MVLMTLELNEMEVGSFEKAAPFEESSVDLEPRQDACMGQEKTA